MKQHFESEYKPHLELYVIAPITQVGSHTMTEDEGLILDGKNDEITQGCINRIVDNLNKLAEHNNEWRRGADW